MADLEETFSLYAHEDNLPGLDADGACHRLSTALSIPTVTGADAAVFSALHAYIRSSFPRIAAAASFEEFGSNLLITLNGSDPSLQPLIMIAHQDVVPAEEASWTHPPFSGYMDDDYIWGRGSLDIKGMMFAELEALEIALSDARTPSRTVILAFGDDEETESAGASLLASILAERGVHDAFLLDEGTTTYMDGALFGAPGTTVQGACLSQKGFANVRITAHGEGGHSSNPFGGSSLERISEAICALRSAMPEPHITPLIAQALDHLCVEQAEDCAQLLAKARGSYPYVADTMAVTQVFGSAASANMLPGDAAATINFRLLPGTDSDAFLARMRDALTEGNGFEVLHCTPAARIDEADGEIYRALRESFEYAYPQVELVPLFMCGGCDAIRYEEITKTAVRLLPYLPPPEDEDRIHAVDERIPRRTYLQSIRMLEHFLTQILFS